MEESVIADVSGAIWDSTSGSEFSTGRVMMSERRLILATEDRQTTVPVDDIFDVAPNQAPAHLDPASEMTATIGFVVGPTRHTATIGAGTDTIDRLVDYLFRVRLSGTDVFVAHPSAVDGREQSTPPEPATLRVSAERIGLDRQGGRVAIRSEDIAGFERVAGDSAEARVTISIGHRSDGRSVTTDVTFDSPATVNVFGRYLRAHSGGTAESPSTIGVLFVDDEPGFVELVAAHARRDGRAFDIELAEDALEGLDRLDENPDIDCVVSDYRMPRMNGVEFLRAVREVRPNLPFIMFTGKGSEEVAEEALAAGVTDYLRKADASDQYGQLIDRIERAVVQQRPHTSA